MLYNDTPSMFFTLGVNGEILSANQFGADHLGYTVDEIVGKCISDLHEEDEQAPVLKKVQECANERLKVHHWEARMRRRDGSKAWIRTAARVMSDNTQDTDPILVVCEDITEAYKLSEQLKYQAGHDALTGLMNRNEFERRLQNMLSDSKDNDTRHALLYMDLDNFKVINDTCGHNAGDELLRQLKPVLRKHITDDDLLARLGGDEFAVLLSNCDPEQAVSAAQTLHRAVTDYRFIWHDVSSRISASIGVVAIDHTTENIATLLSAADTACYSAKEEGLKHVHLYQPDDKVVVRRHREMTWITKIDKALEEERFELFYQRIVPAKTMKPDSLEAGKHYELLLRMRDEDGKIVMPGSFLPAAERYKYTTQLDRWVVGHALQWLSNHPGHVDELSICSINLSGHSIGDGDFLDYLTEQLESSSVPPSKICFELTETAAVANLLSATELMEELRATGCRFALDDFGTGLSSFDYLKHLPIDFVKIDGQFISNIVTDPVDYAMVKSINEIATVMSKKTVAEFVNSEATLTMLRSIGIDYAQGYEIAKPKPLSTLLPST
ncbi:MAG: Cyclic di-GMP phosphodiesterase PdeB [Gammaproteobacteria bacterium]|nr:Cyclic di-GMP phosphodiesterase PdeB [Gammaproteobacteria bacterium]